MYISVTTLVTVESHVGMSGLKHLPGIAAFQDLSIGLQLNNVVKNTEAVALITTAMPMLTKFRTRDCMEKMR
jgi:hypothetical protein